MTATSALIGISVLLWLCGVFVVMAQEDSDPNVSRQAIIVRASPMLTPEGKPDKLEFSRGAPSDTEGWVRGRGGWQIQSAVHHHGLACATYELGARFGAGNPGCTDVQWLSVPMFVSRETQCNGASVSHMGGDVTPELESDFSRITCVERLVRCSGNCK